MNMRVQPIRCEQIRPGLARGEDALSLVDGAHESDVVDEARRLAGELHRDQLGLVARHLETRAAEGVAELDVGDLVDLLGRVDVLHVIVERLAYQQALGLPRSRAQGASARESWRQAAGGGGGHGGGDAAAVMRRAG